MQVRHLNALAPEPVRTGGFRNPGFWSPDSRSFVFSDGTNLKKMRVPDGAPEIVANDVATLVGGSWSDNGSLLVAGAVRGGPGLFVVPAGGGVAKRVEVPLTKDGFFLYWPEFLPGSEDFLVMAAASQIEESEIYLATLRDGRAADPVLLMKNATAVRYTPAGGGRILFVRNDNLYAQTLNRTTRTLEGGPELIQQRVASSPSFYAAHFSVSRTGVVAWRPGTAGLSQVTIFDREGKEIGTAGPPTVVQTLRLAPDETRLLVGFNQTAWLLEPGRPGRQQLEQGNLGTLWSPDGSKLIDDNPRKREPRHGTLCYRARASSRVGETVRNVVCARHFSGRQGAAAQSGATGYDGVLAFAGRRTERTDISASDGRDDFTCPLFARRALDCVHGLRGGE